MKARFFHKRLVGPVVMAVVLVIALPAIASSSASITLWSADFNCQATAWHTHGGSTFQFGTSETWDCSSVKVQGRYFTDAPPYGWVTTSWYSSSSSVSQGRSDVVTHDWSKHQACGPACGEATLY